MLLKKMFRDIKSNISQFITIFLMIFLGIMVFSGIKAYMGGMENAANKFYTDTNLEDLIAISNNFESEMLDKIKGNSHVLDAERKLSLTSTIKDMDDRTLELNFIESNNIAKLHIAQGEEFDKNKSGIWLDEYFANKNDLKVGDSITLKFDFGEIEEKIVALVNVADHVYDIKDESAIFPNHIDYGFAYLSVNEITEDLVKAKVMKEANIESEEIFDMVFKDFNYKEYIVFPTCMIDVDDEVNKSIVKENLENDIENIIAITDIKDSFSYSTYQGEIEEGQTYVGVFSSLFLFIAILSVITTMTRVVKKQRMEIGILKALGFTNFKITLHYVGYGFFVALFATICGLIVGPLFIGNVFLGMEFEYFELPQTQATLSQSSIVLSIITVAIVSFVTYLTCRKELKKPAADTLRIEMPKVKAKDLNITTKGIFKKLGFSSKWNIRDIIRNKFRTLMGIAGVCGCCMLLVCAFGMLDTMNNFVDIQFDKLYNFKYKLVLNENISKDRIEELKEKYSSATSKTLMIEIDNTQDGETKKISNNILVDDSKDMLRFVNHNLDFVKLETQGAFVTEKFAKLNGYEIGDSIKFHILGEDKYYTAKIVGFDRDPQNQNVKMTKEYLESLDIEYTPDTIYTDIYLDKNEDIDGVKVIQDIEALKTGILDMLNTMKTMVVLVIVVAAILGGVIIYNLGILSFTEKRYQFATLRVLGFDDKKIKNIYEKQNIWICIISIILGLPLGYIMTDYIFKMALADTYDFGAHITFKSYIFAIVGTFVVSIIMSKLLSRKVKDIDMVTSLKINE